MGTVEIQVIPLTDRQAQCCACGGHVHELGASRFLGVVNNTNSFRSELFQCECGSLFWCRTDIFDDHGHIHGHILTSDPNAEGATWRDSLTPEQAAMVERHLRVCPECVWRFQHESEMDGWFGQFLEEVRAGHHGDVEGVLADTDVGCPNGDDGVADD